MDNYTVYMHVSPSGKRYIGITGQKKTAYGYVWRYESEVV